MGRSRAVSQSTDEDLSQRSKRRRVPSSGETLDTVASGQGTNEGKKALYHCNYCNKDISGKIRIKCVKCPDFDLCVECYSVGAEITPHKSNHPYRVMDNLSFPLICPDWNADEEMLLLEGIEMYGLGNSAEVAEHVGTKSKQQCIEHYKMAYLNSPCYPLPDMSHVVGKNRKELLAMAKVQGEGKKGFPSAVGNVPKEELSFSPSRVKIEELIKEGPVGQSPSSLTADGDSGESKISVAGCNNTNTVSSGAGKQASQFKDVSDRIKVESLAAEDSQTDRKVRGKKPKNSGEERPRPSMLVLSGYNPKRNEFDPEYDSGAEQLLAEMEFKDTDTEAERELKLRVLRIYSSRLDERKRRKEFVLERNLLHPHPLEYELSSEEREIYNHCKVFMRFQTQEEHYAFVEGLIEEHRIRKRIQELQDARIAGCRTRAEADAFIAQKRKKEYESNALKAKETHEHVTNGNVLQRANRPVKEESEGSPQSQSAVDNHKMKVSMGVESGGKGSSSATTGAIAKSLDTWDITGLPGAELLTETEQQLCCQNRLMPCHYLKMLEILTFNAVTGNITKRSDAYHLFKVDANKVDRVYDMAVKKGLVKRDEAPMAR